MIVILARKIQTLAFALIVVMPFGTIAAQTAWPGTRPGAGGIPRMPSAAPADTTKYLKVQALSPLTLEWGTPSGGGGSNPPGLYYADDYSIDPANGGATNSANFQSAIDAITAAGGGILILDVGTYEINNVGTSPYNATRDYCIELKSNVWIRGQGDATIIKLANAQQDDTADLDMIVAGNSTDNYGIENLQMTFNTANQTGYTGGYQQTGNGGAGITTGITTGGAGGLTTNFRCVNVLFDDFFSVPANIIDCTGAFCRDVRVDNVGEGFQFVRSFDTDFVGYTYNDTNGNAVGDGFEIANGERGRFINFEINDSVAGSGIDVAGKNYLIANGVIKNSANGVVVQNDGANPSTDNSDNVLVTGVTCYMDYVGGNVGDAFSLNCNDKATGGDCHVVFANCHAFGPDVGPPTAGTARGFQISRISGAGEGECEAIIEGCSVSDMATAYSVTTVNNVSGSGNVATRCTNGVLVNSVNDTVRGETTVNLSVDIYGCEGYGVTDVTGATHAPVGRISGYWAGNGTTLTGTATNASALQQYQGEADWILSNTRPIRAESMAASTDVIVSGESAILFTHTELRNLLNAHDNQIVSVIFTQACTLQGSHVGASRNIDTSAWREGDNTFAANESLTLQYDATAGLWYELSREQFDFDPLFKTSISGGAHSYVNSSTFTSGDVISLANISGTHTGNIQSFATSVNTSGAVFSTQKNLGSGNAYHLIWSAGTGDAYVYMLAGAEWSIGPDNSDGDKLKIANGANPGTSSRMEMLTTGQVGMGTTATSTAQLTLPASTTSKAPLNVPAGAAPTAPVNGDIWTEGTDLKIRLGGTTYTITKS